MFISRVIHPGSNNKTRIPRLGCFTRREPLHRSHLSRIQVSAIQQAPPGAFQAWKAVDSCRQFKDPFERLRLLKKIRQKMPCFILMPPLPPLFVIKIFTRATLFLEKGDHVHRLFYFRRATKFGDCLVWWGSSEGPENCGKIFQSAQVRLVSCSSSILWNRYVMKRVLCGLFGEMVDGLVI